MSTDLTPRIPLAPSSDPGPYRAEDYFARDEEERCELIYGHIYVSPSPTSRHQLVTSRIWALFDEAAARTGGLAFVSPLDVRIADHSVVQPDVIYVSRTRRDVVRNYVDGIPNLLVEVLSPGSVRRDRLEKRRLYAEAGVPELWIVDPGERQIDFLVNRHGRYEIVEPRDGVYRSLVVPEIEIDVVAFWNAIDRTMPPGEGVN